MEAILIHIKSKAPNAYNEFCEHVKKNHESFLAYHNLSLENIPQSFLLGIFIEYFDNQSIDFSIAETNQESIFNNILEVFEEYEKVISHYS